jgi:hypothetical protein
MGNKVGYAIVKEEHTIKKRILPQNTVFSAKQCAIIGAIQSEKNSRHEIVIITDSLSTIIAAESRTPTKNPKTQTNSSMRCKIRTRKFSILEKNYFFLSFLDYYWSGVGSQLSISWPSFEIPTTDTVTRFIKNIRS